MCFCENLARSQALEPPETLTSPWLPLLCSINSQSSPSTRTHVTISSHPCNHPGSAALLLSLLLFQSSPAPTFTPAASYTGPLPPKPHVAWRLLPSSSHSVAQPVALTASPRVAAAGHECPAGTLPCPSPFSSARWRPSIAGDPRLVGALPAAGSSGLLFPLLRWAVGGMLAEQGMGCTARAFLADALLRPRPALRAPPPADSQASLSHKLLCEFEDHFSHTCLGLQKPVPKHLELTLGRKQRPIRDGWGGKSLLVNQRLPLSPQCAAIPAACEGWELTEWLGSSPFAYVFRRGDLSLRPRLANTTQGANCLACARGAERQHWGRWRCWRQAGEAAGAREAGFRVTALGPLSIHCGGDAAQWGVYVDRNRWS